MVDFWSVVWYNLYILKGLGTSTSIRLSTPQLQEVCYKRQGLADRISECIDANKLCDRYIQLRVC